MKPKSIWVPKAWLEMRHSNPTFKKPASTKIKHFVELREVLPTKKKVTKCKSLNK